MCFFANIHGSQFHNIRHKGFMQVTIAKLCYFINKPNNVYGVLHTNQNVTSLIKRIQKHGIIS